MKYYLLIFCIGLFTIGCTIDDNPDETDMFCEIPTSVAAINITETTAVIVWSHPEKGGEGPSYVIEYGIDGFELGEGLLVASTLFKDQILINLQPSSTYNYYIRTTCENGLTAAIAGPNSFTTD